MLRCKKWVVANVYVGSSLISLYSKCGEIIYAYKMFEEMPVRNLVSWTAIIHTFAQECQVDMCLELYRMMRNSMLELYELTFTSILSACTVNGALCHGTRGFEPVRHSRIPYYESKSSGSGTMSTGFALPWARQENGFSSQLVCVRIFLDPSSALSPRLATNSPNSTGSPSLNSKEYRAIVFSTHTFLKHVSNN